VNLSSRSLFIAVSFVAAAAVARCCSRCRCPAVAAILWDRCLLHGLHASLHSVVVLFGLWLWGGGGAGSRMPKLCELRARNPAPRAYAAYAHCAPTTPRRASCNNNRQQTNHKALLV
jgi:hypothetical protein